MKKKLAIMFIAAAALALSSAVWLCAYHNRKSNDNLPNLQLVSGMEEAEINEIVCGYRKAQLHYIWPDPDETRENEDVWSLGDDRFLRVNYNNKDEAVICDLFIALFPDNTKTVRIRYSAGSAVEAERELTRDEITDVMDWALGLDLEPQSDQEGDAPNEIYAGGEEYLFDINDGEETFSYVWIDNNYIYKDGKWYRVNNPAIPPVDFIS